MGLLLLPLHPPPHRHRRHPPLPCHIPLLYPTEIPAETHSEGWGIYIKVIRGKERRVIMSYIQPRPS